jgi:hypothetical protein
MVVIMMQERVFANLVLVLVEIAHPSPHVLHVKVSSIEHWLGIVVYVRMDIFRIKPILFVHVLIEFILYISLHK